MFETNSNKEILKHLQEKYPAIYPILGGDGSLISNWRNAFKLRKGILPLRNYSRCETHEELFKALCENSSSGIFTFFRNFEFKQTLHPLITATLPEDTFTNSGDDKSLALSEIQIRNKDITSAMRFDVYINNRKYYSNVISSGILFSTSLGSTGYWQSLTRMIFRENWGMTFIAPTQGVNSVILKSIDRVVIKFVRDTDIEVAFDKNVKSKHVEVDDEIFLLLSPEKVSIFGYDQFMCYECRKNRNSTILQNQYFV